jgi:formiminotetrahydrofolate cyclodeaminase
MSISARQVGELIDAVASDEPVPGGDSADRSGT